jgi:hypothetical protein
MLQDIMNEGGIVPFEITIGMILCDLHKCLQR